MLREIKPLLLTGRSTAMTSLAIVVLASVSFASSKVDIQVSGSRDKILIEYRVTGHTIRPVRISGDEFEEISLEGEALNIEKGSPGLPSVCRSIIIPDNRKMSVRVIDSDYYEMPARIAPSKGSIPRYINPEDVPFSFGPQYEQDAFYPEDAVTIYKPYIIRDYRGMVVKLNPFQYNPVKRSLRVYTRLEVEVYDAGPGEANLLNKSMKPESLSRAFHILYKHQFLNYDMYTRYEPLTESGGLLIIAHDPWVPYLQPLIAHKTSIGMDTELVPVSTIGNTPETIKALIQDRYSLGNLSFVLLVGDIEEVASPDYVMYEEIGPSDPTYSLLAGDDTYPDIMVGRFSAQTIEHVMTQVERTVEYEQMPATGQDWFWRGTGLGSDQGPGDDGEMDYEHIENIRLMLLDHGYTEVDQFYDPDIVTADVCTALNEGRGIVNHCGHGGPGGWGSGGISVWHVNALINHSMLPFAFSVACATGAFQYDTCLGEAFLQATHGDKPTGAIGFFGGSLSQNWSEPMEAQDEFNILLVNETYVSYGTLCYAGCCSMMDDYGQGGVDMFMTWHLFGDPSVRTVGVPPSPSGLRIVPFDGLVSCGPVGGPFQPVSLQYSLTNLEANPITFEVSTNETWIDLSTAGGIISPGSEQYVTVTINDVADTFDDGQFVARIDFVNSTDHVGDTERLVVLDVGVPMPVYSYSLDMNPGWSVTGEWEFGQPAGLGGDSYGYPDPNSGATGENVYGVNLNGDYSPTSGGPYYLTTTPIDCRDISQVSLRFQRWLNTDFQPYTYAMLEVSSNGILWVPIWQNEGVEIAECAWDEQTYDISAVADSCGSVYIRWGYQTDGPAYPYSGWNIDDIEILGVYRPAGVPKSPGNISVASDGVGGIILTWSPVTEDIDGNPISVDHYSVFRKTTAFYSVESLVPAGMPSLPQFIDEDVAGNPGANYFYRIIAVSDTDISSEPSVPVGEFDYLNSISP